MQWVEWYVWKKNRCGATPQKQKGKVAKIIKWWKNKLEYIGEAKKLEKETAHPTAYTAISNANNKIEIQPPQKQEIFC